MNTNIPDNLMTNVEKNLRQHIKNKKKRIYKTFATAATISIVVLSVSVFAYAKFSSDIMYKQEIDLARENKNITKVNQSFKYKDVDFIIKEIVADDTGMEVIYDVSDPKYSISDVSFGDKDNKAFETWSYSLSNSTINSNENSFYISMDSTATNYMHNNPITITINNLKINNEQSDSPLDKLSSLFNHNDEPKVDWTLKMQVPMQQVKVIPVNKEYSLDIGALKVNSFKAGVLKSVLDYTFVPKDENITMVNPLFSVRLDNEYILSNSRYNNGLYEASISSNIANNNHATGVSEHTNIGGTQEFSSIYYKNINEIGIKLIDIQATYRFKDSNVYNVDKKNLPMDFDFNGEKFKITSMKEKDDSTEYMVEYNKTNRLFSELSFDFNGNSICLDSNSENIQYKDQCSKDKIYSSLVKQIPNLKDMEKNFRNIQNGATNTKITTKSKISESGTVEFTIDSATKNLIYDEEEVIIHKK